MSTNKNAQIDLCDPMYEQIKDCTNCDETNEIETIEEMNAIEKYKSQQECYHQCGCGFGCKDPKIDVKKRKKKTEFSKIIVFIMFLLNVAIIGFAVDHMVKTGDASALSYVGVGDAAGLGSAFIFYSKKAMQENKKKIAKGILDDMGDNYSFEQTVQLLEIICRD